MPDRALKMLHNPATVATALLIIAIDRLGIECMGWLPEVLEDELQGLSPRVDVPPRNFDKLHGLILALTTDRFYHEPKIFMVVCNALDPAGPNTFATFDPPDAEEMAWAVTEMRLHEPAQDLSEARRYGPRVVQTMQMLKDEEMPISPSFLRFLKSQPIEGGVAQESPELWESVWQTQLAEKGRVERSVARRFAMLMSQLKRLELQNGDMDGLQKVIDRMESLLDTPE